MTTNPDARRRRSLAAVAACISIAWVTPSAASTLFSTAPLGATADVALMSGGYTIGQKFTLGTKSSLDQIEFGLVEESRTDLSSLTWAILDNRQSVASKSFGGGTVSSFTKLASSNPQPTYDGFNVSYSISPLVLEAGSYWLTLTASSNNGGALFWRSTLPEGFATVFEQTNPAANYQNSGPYRHLFSLYGAAVAAAPPVSPAPEPAVWSLVLLGFTGLGSMVRARRRALKTC